MDHKKYAPDGGKMLNSDSEIRHLVDFGMPVISMVHEHVHRGEYFQFTHVFEAVPAGGKRYMSFRPQLKQSHLLISIASEGKIRFRSYVGTLWLDDGTSGDIFNRKVGGPAADTLLYYDGTPDLGNLGPQRFDVMIPGGGGPQSPGSTGGEREESQIFPGIEITIEIENDLAQAQDIGVAFGWYEVA